MLNPPDSAYWEDTIIDGGPPLRLKEGLACLCAGDVDGDGQEELIVGGFGVLLWYRPTTGQRGIIDYGNFHVGATLADVDGDGGPELLVCRSIEAGANSRNWQIVSYKPSSDTAARWNRSTIDPLCTGGAHDLVVMDVDGDGQFEIVANAVHCRPWGIFIYRRPADPAMPWPKFAVQEGVMGEGLAAADLDGDGKIEIINGPNLWHQPAGGPYAGPWQQVTFASSHREMCRVDLIDVNNDGKLDIVLIDSEYLEGQLSWFENRCGQPGAQWPEHFIQNRLVFAHSLQCRREGVSVRIFLCEMDAGGWSAAYNYDARIMEITSDDNGHSWTTRLLDQGQGTHQAILYDIDHDGQLEVLGKGWDISTVHMWKKNPNPSPITRYRHRFIDRDKPGVSTDLRVADIDGDGREDIVTGRWWYHMPTGRRYEIPGVSQVIACADIDRDGRAEIIAAVQGRTEFHSSLAYLKAKDPFAGSWDIHPIGVGVGDWPHGACLAPLLPGGRWALVTTYHSSDVWQQHYPEIWAVPDDPVSGPWIRRTLAPISYGEQVIACDVNGDGRLDLICGPWWIENCGDGRFIHHRIAPPDCPSVCRVAVMDIAGHGRPDVVIGFQAFDYAAKKTPPVPLAWFECPEDPANSPWPMHIIDHLRCPHSLCVADFDNDGRAEIAVSEHDPFAYGRTRCRLFVYKPADPRATMWKRWPLDDRFEQHNGCQPITLDRGKIGILGIGWTEGSYLHLWEPV